MTTTEREALIRKHLEEEVWPTEDEMRAFVAECERNPVTYEELMADLKTIRLDAEHQLSHDKVKA